MLKTRIDELVELLKKEEGADYTFISEELDWDENYVEKCILILEKAELTKTHYPVDMLRKPWAEAIEAETPKKKEIRADGKKIEGYSITGRGGHLSGDVEIHESSDEMRPVYNITLPTVSTYTRAYMEHVKVDVSKKLSLELLKRGEESAVESYDKRYSAIMELLVRELGEKDKRTNEVLATMILNEMFGLGELEALISDRRLEEVVINSSDLPVSVYHRKLGWLKTNIFMEGESNTENYSAQIARKVGRQISVLNPILDARLTTGDRANATLYPISAHGNTITLRLFSKNPWTIISYLKKDHHTMSPEMAALLWQAMQYEMNLVIAGGTASGKTSALNGLLALIQPFQRVVTIEDTRELSLPTYQWNWVPLVTRPPNPEGYGEVTMLDLIVNSLRMRPDRIVMGEIRRKKEAEVLFEAMHTGHSVYATIHADTGSQVIKRLVEPPIEVPPSEVDDINLLLVQYRDRRRNLRRTLEISEIIPGTDRPETNRIFSWKPRNDTFEMIKKPRRYTEQMNLHTGMTEREVNEDQRDKARILTWMSNNDLQDIDDVGKVMKVYYSDPDTILKAAEKGLKPDKVL